MTSGSKEMHSPFDDFFKCNVALGNKKRRMCFEVTDSKKICVNILAEHHLFRMEDSSN